MIRLELLFREWKQLWDTFTSVGPLICPDGRVSSLNKSNPIQYKTCSKSLSWKISKSRGTRKNWPSQLGGHNVRRQYPPAPMTVQDNKIMYSREMLVLQSIFAGWLWFRWLTSGNDIDLLIYAACIDYLVMVIALMPLCAIGVGNAYILVLNGIQTNIYKLQEYFAKFLTFIKLPVISG